MDKQDSHKQEKQDIKNQENTVAQKDGQVPVQAPKIKSCTEVAKKKYSIGNGGSQMGAFFVNFFERRFNHA